MNYCDVFISYLHFNSDGTHSLQRIYWRVSDIPFFMWNIQEDIYSRLSQLVFFLFIERECYHNFLKATFSVNNDLKCFPFHTQRYCVFSKDLEYSAQDLWATTMIAHTSFNVLFNGAFCLFFYFIALRRTAKLPKKKGTKV